MKKSSINTSAVHAGEDPSSFYGSVSVPIYNTSIFAFDDAETAESVHNEIEQGYYYGRLGNPTQVAAERAVAAMESAESALCFASGMAAISGIIMSVASPGDRIVAPVSHYSTTGKLLRHLADCFRYEVDLVDMTDLEQVSAAAERGARILWIETPSNPTLQITDINACAAIGHSCGAVVVADNTFATPFNQTPLDLGADIVVHSATKYLGGHSDLTAGVAAGSTEMIASIRAIAIKLLGGNISPFGAWLLHRGIKTLPIRMERHNDNAYAVADMLSRHPSVVAVNYPGSVGHDGHDVAARQMHGGFGGMVSFDLGSRAAAAAFVNNVEICTLATSLGGIETIVQHSTAMTNSGMTPEERSVAGIPDGLVRMSVGIEHIDDIIADIDQALSAL